MTLRSKPLASRLRAALGAALLGGLLLAGCREQLVFYSYRALPPAGWTRGDTLFFEATLPDSAACYRRVVEVRTRGSYPYRFLPVEVGCFSPDGALLSVDTATITVADARGNWLGEGWGGLYETGAPLPVRCLGRAGVYRFYAVCLLDDARVPAVNDVGLKLTLE
ncbi:MAG: gliding motility lipoprotein GldH [Prevotellaceae bacterium]|jgi:gliding motility-associated lipoprotein GldH|nr:gliding motility lipoprotein GldH [Prevotellaceae bacterium]